MAFFENWTINTTLRHFSSREEKGSVCSTENDCNDDHRTRRCFKDFFNIEFYANGSCIANEGHVSIIFYPRWELEFPNILQSIKFRCFASVIDVSGIKKFTRSVALDHQYNRDCRSEKGMFFEEGFGFDKYVKRSTLLNDPPEYLPNDSLTLCLEVDCEVAFFPARLFLPTMCDGLNIDENGECYILTDTEFARYLCKTSSVLSRMVESPMVEKVTGKITVRPNEISSYQLIFYFLCGRELECTLSDLWQLYKFADYYDMPQIKQIWHQLLVSMMSTINTQEMVERVIDTISNLPEMLIKDESLRDIQTLCSDLKKKFEGGTGELDASTASKLEPEWNCELTSTFIEPKFLFRSIKSDYSQFDFYK